jgi:excisionase family DNA binding protein
VVSREASSSPDLLRSAEVASLLRVHPKQVYRLIEKGLPARRVGSEWRFSREEVLAWSAGAGPALAPPGPAGEVAPGGGARGATETAPLLAANGDQVIEVLLGALVRDGRSLLGFVQADRGVAIELLGQRRILLAGFHGGPPPSQLTDARLARLHLVQREVGLGFPASRTFKGVGDLAGLRLASRPATAGVRGHLDAALGASSWSLEAMGVAAREYRSHQETVCAVIRGEADVALTTAAWAARLGLRFHALASEAYDLLLFAENLGHEAVLAACDVAQNAAFRRELGRIPGYDAVRAGDIRYHFGDPPAG